MKIGILGASGMLGSQLVEYFMHTSYKVRAFTRKDLDAESVSAPKLQKLLQDFDYIINAIGIIKPYIHDDNSLEVQRAIKVNALFPHALAEAIKGSDTKLIQIATDCVYDGLAGNYNEDHLHNALDVYGKTKSLGEVINPHCINLRCSIIGPEKKANLSLLEWFLGQPKNASVHGYTNHLWNGVTTLAFAKICHGIIKNTIHIPQTQHLIPANTISKAELLQLFADTYARQDITITAKKTATQIDRTLSTSNATLNALLWTSAGYANIPTIQTLIEEMNKHYLGCTY